MGAASLVFSIRPETMQYALIRVGKDAQQSFAYLLMIPMMLAVFAAMFFLVWVGSGLAVASAVLLKRRLRCSECGESLGGGFSIGRFCDACGKSLAPWVYLKPAGDPGGSPNMDSERASTDSQLVSPSGLSGRTGSFAGPALKRGDYAIWVEIGSLALTLGGLCFFMVAGFQLAVYLGHLMLTGSDLITMKRGIVFGWKEQVVAIANNALPGIALVAGAWLLRFFLDE
jgi:hypothetical protein